MRHSDFEMCLMRYLELTQDHDNRDGEGYAADRFFSQGALHFPQAGRCRLSGRRCICMNKKLRSIKEDLVQAMAAYGMTIDRLYL